MEKQESESWLYSGTFDEISYAIYDDFKKMLKDDPFFCVSDNHNQERDTALRACTSLLTDFLFRYEESLEKNGNVQAGADTDRNGVIRSVSIRNYFLSALKILIVPIVNYYISQVMPDQPINAGIVTTAVGAGVDWVLGKLKEGPLREDLYCILFCITEITGGNPEAWFTVDSVAEHLNLCKECKYGKYYSALYKNVCPRLTGGSCGMNKREIEQALAFLADKKIISVEVVESKYGDATSKYRFVKLRARGLPSND